MRPSKREHLLDTAERLFYEEGFHATGIDRVVEAAGVARMTLYNHFPSKEALVQAVIERRHGRYLGELRDAMAGRGGEPALSAVIEVHCRWLETVASHGCMLIKAMGEFERHQAGIHALALRLKRELLDLIREALAADGLACGQPQAERVLMVLEGANALLPVLGVERTLTHTWAMVPAALRLEVA